MEADGTCGRAVDGHDVRPHLGREAGRETADADLGAKDFAAVDRVGVVMSGPTSAMFCNRPSEDVPGLLVVNWKADV